MRGCLRKGGGHLRIRSPVDRGRDAEALLEEMVEVAAVVITCPQRHFPDGEGAVLQQRRGGLQTNIPQILLIAGIPVFFQQQIKVIAVVVKMFLQIPGADRGRSRRGCT